MALSVVERIEKVASFGTRTTVLRSGLLVAIAHLMIAHQAPPPSA